MRKIAILVLLVIAPGSRISAVDHGNKQVSLGVLILAHGHEKTWNSQVEELPRQLPFPAEVALGMAHKNSIADALTRLQRRGVQRVVVVPLFISTYSPIVRASAYLLGLTAERPPELEMLNNMPHGLQDPRRGHYDRVLDLTPIRPEVPVQMTSALDDHPLVAEILADRAMSISRNPSRETIILVGHGPVSEADNRHWLENMERLAGRIKRRCGFLDARALTLMQDGPADLREKAAVELRRTIQSAARRGDVLLVPLLLSRGGIESRLSAILAGLKFRMPKRFLLPDSRIALWITEQADRANRQVLADGK